MHAIVRWLPWLKTLCLYQRAGMSVLSYAGKPLTRSFSMWQWLHYVSGSVFCHCLFMNSTASAFFT